ncbi:MAG: thioredoxin domain-containing protein [Gammaproteobacteria bacterium]|nr:thioredoxin domain-containing protein [Gammaproteobacteria bacterium]MDH5691501.1 thioredoxin domain-containing protein [Gammaproteobacteria bacterium]
MKINSQAFKQLDQFDYHSVLEETKGISLVLFVKQSCSSCKSWASLLLNYQNFHPAIQLFLLDVERDPGLGEEFELFHLPGIFLYIDGQFHATIQSEARLSQFEAAVQKAVFSLPQETP